MAAREAIVHSLPVPIMVTATHTAETVLNGTFLNEQSAATDSGIWAALHRRRRRRRDD